MNVHLRFSKLESTIEYLEKQKMEIEFLLKLANEDMKRLAQSIESRNFKKGINVKCLKGHVMWRIMDKDGLYMKVPCPKCGCYPVVAF